MVPKALKWNQCQRANGEGWILCLPCANGLTNKALPDQLDGKLGHLSRQIACTGPTYNSFMRIHYHRMQVGCRYIFRHWTPLNVAFMVVYLIKVIAYMYWYATQENPVLYKIWYYGVASEENQGSGVCIKYLSMLFWVAAIYNPKCAICVTSTVRKHHINIFYPCLLDMASCTEQNRPS